jgi:hypothetical protein
LTNNGSISFLTESKLQYISSLVTITEVKEYGGYGLVAIPSTNPIEKQPWRKLTQVADTRNDDEPLINELDELFTIPEDIIISVPSVLHKFSSNLFKL